MGAETVPVSDDEEVTAAASTDPDAPLDREASVTQLEKRLAATPRAIFPYQHAGLAYRLGLAYAESAGTHPADGLRKALACYDLAASIFDPRFDPVPHARVLNAAGAAHRALGDRKAAAELFAKSAQLLEDRDRDDERAGAYNNLGLVLAELGQPDEAINACDHALALFDSSSAEGVRGWAAARHTRGMAHSALGTEAGVVSAVEDYATALEVVGPADAPFHYALLQQAAGVAGIALAGLRPDEADQLLDGAARAIEEALTIFTRAGFPYQYALAKNNLGLALSRRARLPGHENDFLRLRWALASFEDTVAVLDPRVYRTEWQQGYTNLEQAQDELDARGPTLSRAEHFAALLAASASDVRAQMLRERLTRLLMLPEPKRHTSLVELAAASARADYETVRAHVAAEIGILMELPRPDLHDGLRARYEAHRLLDGTDRETADRGLDQAIGDALVGPQKIYVRDFLYALGWERP
jgi:tetratricopeptide (TPR) repeat protein